MHKYLKKKTFSESNLLFSCSVNQLQIIEDSFHVQIVSIHEIKNKILLSSLLMIITLFKDYKTKIKLKFIVIFK